MCCSAWDVQFALKVNENRQGLKLPTTSQLLLCGEVPLGLMGEDTKLHPAPSLRTLPSLQLTHEARSGQEAMGRTFPQTTGGGELPACTVTPSPDKHSPSQERNLSDTHRLTPHLLPALPDQHHRLLQQALHRKP